MSTKTWGLLAAGVVIVAAGAVAVAFASDWGDGHRKGAKRGQDGNRGGQAMHLIQYDANKDGTITRAEVDAGLEAEFRGADTNADGKLDALEFQKYNDARKAERKARIDAWRAKREAEGRDVDGKERPPHDRTARNFDPMKNMDWDRDGFISFDEFANRTRAQAMRADRDGDGAIAVADLQKKRDRGRHDRGPNAPATTEPAPQ